jgi:diaminohydroxyphosphoribosylaminopyrimidine deaminase/5-amino-6-(5-phosphoribosylamino)uracil reductase
VLNPSGPAKTLLITSGSAQKEKLEDLRSRGVEVWCMEEAAGRIPLRPLLRRLADREVMSLMIEGGSELNASAIREGIVDKVILFLAPRLIGGIAAPSLIGGAGVKELAVLPLKKFPGADQIYNDYRHAASEDVQSSIGFSKNGQRFGLQKESSSYDRRKET